MEIKNRIRNTQKKSFKKKTAFGNWYKKNDGKTRRRHANNITKRYTKARYWLERKIPFKAFGKRIYVPSRGINFFLRDVENSNVELFNVFEHPFDKEKILFVEKITRHYPTRTGIGFKLSEASVDHKRTILTATIEFYDKEAFASSLYWEHNSLEEEFGGIGLGLFMDYLRLHELSKRGIKKWTGTVDFNKQAVRFADFRGFEDKGRPYNRTRNVPQLGGTKEAGKK